jgi:hypothetical protein
MGDAHVKEQWILAHALNWLNEERGELRLDIDQVVERLLTSVWSAYVGLPSQQGIFTVRFCSFASISSQALL